MFANMSKWRLISSLTLIALFTDVECGGCMNGGVGTPKPKGDPGSLDSARDKALEMHNLFRKWHRGTPTMTLDAKLNSEAQAYAEKLVTEIGCMKHSEELTGDSGENIYHAAQTGGKPFDLVQMTATAIRKWYFEICTRNFKDWPDTNHDLDHFSQLVWKSSDKLGMGFAVDKDNGDLYVVGRYSPRGNFQEPAKMKDNILKINCPRSSICNDKDQPKDAETKAGQCGGAAEEDADDGVGKATISPLIMSAMVAASMFLYRMLL